MSRQSINQLLIIVVLGTGTWVATHWRYFITRTVLFYTLCPQRSEPPRKAETCTDWNKILHIQCDIYL